MNILALDLAISTGWALRENGREESGTETFELKRGQSPGMRYVAFSRWLEDFVIAHPENVAGKPCRHLDVREGWCTHCACHLKDLARVELIVYEQTLPSGPGSIAREIELGLATHVQAFCARYDIKHDAPCYPSTLKKWTTGRGDAKKPAMLEAVERRWKRRCDTADEADAFALLQYTLAELVPATR